MTESFFQPEEMQIAQQKVARFVERHEPSYRLLLYHAALPLVLTPELLNYLRTKFLQGEVPWVAEADLLLSDLCQQVGYEQYVMDSAVRAYLLQEMKRDETLGQARMEAVARLLIHYVRHLSKTNAYLDAHELQAQQWGAMMYIEAQREKAVREITKAFKDAVTTVPAGAADVQSVVNQAEMARLAQITRELAPALEQYPELLEQAGSIGKLLADPTAIQAQELSKGEYLKDSVHKIIAAVEQPGQITVETDHKKGSQPIIYAVLSDIHANFQALQAVEADAVNVARALGAQSLHFVVLGDVVNYGPQPNECIEWVEKHAEIVIQGNCDMDAAEPSYTPPRTISLEYWPIMIWTRAVLFREHKTRIREWQSGLSYLTGRLPTELKDFMLFHSSLRYGHHGMIRTSQDAWENLELLPNDIKYGLFGHTHIQGFLSNELPLWEQHKKDTTMYLVCPESTQGGARQGGNAWKPVFLESVPETSATGCTTWDTLPAHPTLFNPGSVGQPRLSGLQDWDTFHDNRAAYMLLKLDEQMQFQFRRTPYDVEEIKRHLREDVYWPPSGYTNGEDILREEGATPDMLNTLTGDFLSVVRNMETALPKLVEQVLVPQLRQRVRREIQEADAQLARETPFPKAGNDLYTSHEARMRELLTRMDQNHPRYAEALTWQRHLSENLQHTRTQGDDLNSRAERAKIIGQLNSLSLAVLGNTFNDLVRVPRPTEANNLYIAYEDCMRELLTRMDQNHPRYNEALVYQHRLSENLQHIYTYGDNEDSRVERAKIIGQLNSLSLAVLGNTFNDLVRVPRPTEANNLYIAYEDCMRELLTRMDQNHPRYYEALVYQHRLSEHLQHIRLYGDTAELRLDLAQIIDQLNKLSLNALDTAFNDLAQVPDANEPTIPLLSIDDDLYIVYEARIRELLVRMDKTHERYIETLTYQDRLMGNLHRTRLYGDTTENRIERFKIFAQTNELSLDTLGITFSNLVPLPNSKVTQIALRQAREVLTILEKQATAYTSLTIPTSLQTQLEYQREEVARLEAEPPQVSGLGALLPNPFTDMLVIHEASRFVGRNTELRRLHELLRTSSVALIGEPKIGKSSLVYRLIQDWQGRVVGPLDCQSFEDLADFYERLAGLLNVDSNKWGTIRKVLENTPILIILDEFDTAPGFGLTASEMGRFRAVAIANPDFRMLIVCRNSPNKILPDTGAGSPFFNILSSFTLGPLTDAESRTLLNHPWSPDARHFDDTTIEELLALTGNHPFRLQRAAYHRYEAFSDPAHDWRAAYEQNLENMLTISSQSFEGFTDQKREMLAAQKGAITTAIRRYIEQQREIEAEIDPEEVVQIMRLLEPEDDVILRREIATTVIDACIRQQREIEAEIDPEEVVRIVPLLELEDDVIFRREVAITVIDAYIRQQKENGVEVASEKLVKIMRALGIENEAEVLAELDSYLTDDLLMMYRRSAATSIPEFIHIPAESFLMGSDPQKDKNAKTNEQPQHEIWLPSYYIAKTPVTNAQYLAFVQETGHQIPKDWQDNKPPRGKEEHPVMNISWHDALAYCKWLAERTGKAYRLPTEAEWEKAARGTDGRVYPWGDQLPDKTLCNFNNIIGDTTPVGTYSPQGDSPYGCADMAGNVWEWTSSLFESYPYRSDDGREYINADSPRVMRGGAYINLPEFIRCTGRSGYDPSSRHQYNGFRLVISPLVEGDELMSNTLPDFKRRTLETRRAHLIEEYDAIMTQLSHILSAADELKLKRQAQAREAEIAEIDAQLKGRAPQPTPIPQPRKRTIGIPTELSLPLKNTLLQCGEFANNQALQAVLAHEMLTPWRYSVAMTNMPKSQVDMVISQLADQYRSDGQNALVIFLQVLAENYDVATQLHGDLQNLAEQLAAYK